ncbi:defensin-like protein 1 [Tanacetum coccineum]
MAKISKVHTFLFVFLVVSLVVNPGMVVGTKETNKVCERRSKTWSGYCGDSKHCDQQCREWEVGRHELVTAKEREGRAFCYFNC